jgi:hypothetical protein
MTTIAASLDAGVMASDSNVTVEAKGVNYPATKIVRGKGGSLIGASGHAGDCTRFLKWAAAKFSDKEPKWAEAEGQEDSVMGMVMTKEGIYVWTQGDPEPELVNARFFSIGSGSKAARAAMLLGADPVKAVEIACEVDKMYSALPVQILRLNDKDGA